MARQAVEDRRPLVVFTLSDADPFGYQMSVSIARKLQALRDVEFPPLEYRLIPVTLKPGQADELDLPSTPLKETEKRGDRWQAAFGREQTEIDAALALFFFVFKAMFDEPSHCLGYDFIKTIHLAPRKPSGLQTSHRNRRPNEPPQPVWLAPSPPHRGAEGPLS